MAYEQERVAYEEKENDLLGPPISFRERQPIQHAAQPEPKTGPKKKKKKGDKDDSGPVTPKLFLRLPANIKPQGHEMQPGAILFRFPATHPNALGLEEVCVGEGSSEEKNFLTAVKNEVRAMYGTSEFKLRQSRTEEDTLGGRTLRFDRYETTGEGPPVLDASGQAQHPLRLRFTIYFYKFHGAVVAIVLRQASKIGQAEDSKGQEAIQFSLRTLALGPDIPAAKRRYRARIDVPTAGWPALRARRCDIASGYCRMEPAAASPRVRLVHFSDIHITARPLGWQRGDWLSKRFTGWLNHRWLGRASRFRQADTLVTRLMENVHARPPDRLVFSGDATALGFEAEFARAAALLGVSGPQALPGLAVPGNHDYYTRAVAESGLFEHYFAPWQAGERIGGARYPFAQRVGPVWLVAVNSCTGNLRPWDASGGVDDAQLARLRELLQRLEPGPRILITHYPVALANGRRERGTHGLRNLQELMQVATEGGIRLWLHGHRHGTYFLPDCRYAPFPILCAGQRDSAQALELQRIHDGWSLLQGAALVVHAAPVGTGHGRSSSSAWTRACNRFQALPRISASTSSIRPHTRSSRRLVTRARLQSAHRPRMMKLWPAAWK